MKPDGAKKTVARTALRRLANAFRDALFPLKCLLCGTFFREDVQQASRSIKENGAADSCRQDLEQLFIHLMRSFLCPACIRTFVPLKSPMCRRCGLMFKSGQGEDHLCETCIRQGNNFQMARACGAHDQALMAIIHSFKYGEKVQLARPLSALLFAAFLVYWRDRPVDLIVPMPLHQKRFQERGFNQSYLIVKHWSSISAVCEQHLKAPPIDRNVLKRIRPTLPQTGFGRRKRMSNVKDAFALSSIREIRDRRVLIVDDVYTTGATAGECARVLLKGGAGEVDVLTLSRAI